MIKRTTTTVFIFFLLAPHSFAQMTTHPQAANMETRTVSSGYEVKTMEGSKVTRIGSQVIPEAPEEYLAQQLKAALARIDAMEAKLSGSSKENTQPQNDDIRDELNMLKSSYQKLNTELLGLNNLLNQRMLQLENIIRDIQTSQVTIKNTLSETLQKQTTLAETVNALKAPPSTDKNKPALPVPPVPK